MKRKNNLYEDLYKLENIEEAFQEICQHTKNREKVAYFKEYKCLYISRIYDLLEQRKYKVGPYNIFYIYEPKKRRVVSQKLVDKVINHLVAKHILIPSVMPCLLDTNVASRKDMGCKAGIQFARNFHRKFSINYGTYYILKVDIHNFFGSINHDILKEKLVKKIKDKDALKIIFDIIDSDNIGLSIGNMTSQILAIFFLNDLDYFVKETLHIKGYVRYQDDMLLFHQSKDYLKECLVKIKDFVEKEGLTLNPKTRIYKNTDNFIFLGRSKTGNYARYRTVKRKLKKRKYLYDTNKISLASYTSSLICYKYLLKKM